MSLLAVLDLVEVQGGKVVSKATTIKGPALVEVRLVGVLADLVFRISTALKANSNLVRTHITLAGTQIVFLHGSKHLSTLHPNPQGRTRPLI